MNARKYGLAIAAFVFFFDQLTKWIVTGPLGVDQLGDQIVLLPIFNLTYTENQGISGGFLHASTDTMRWLLVSMTGAIALAVAYWIGRENHRTDQVALGMVLGGALGNITDRVRLGHVVDFADFHLRGVPSFLCMGYDDGVCRPFLIFNVGDAAISIAVVMLLLRAFVTSKDKETGAEPKETIDHA